MTTNTSKEARVYQLTKELEEAKLVKKHAAKTHNEEIKRIQDEIKAIFAEENP